MFRTSPPPIDTKFKLSLEPVHSLNLPSGRILTTLHSPTIEVFRLELVFHFGLLSFPNVESANMLPRLMLMGTKSKTAYEIASDLENAGGFLDIQVGVQRTVLTLHGLTQYFEAYLPILEDILSWPTIPEQETDIMRQAALQNVQVEQGKPVYLANKAFKKLLYGTESILGTTAENYAEVHTESLRDIHKLSFLKSNPDVWLSGNFEQVHLNRLLQFVENIYREETLFPIHFPPILEPQRQHIEVKESIQSSLILGQRLFNRSHPDYIPFLVSNTLLGGYFGSRLMKNIREEKGLTYGISSSLSPSGPDGVWSIRADVNKEKLELALVAIEEEINILKENAPPEEELEMVKNYLRGNILSSSNTIFDLMDKHKAIRYEALGADFYEKMSTRISEVSPEEVKTLVNKYIRNFTILSAG
jgi:zinc protease